MAALACRANQQISPPPGTEPALKTARAARPIRRRLWVRADAGDTRRGGERDAPHEDTFPGLGEACGHDSLALLQVTADDDVVPVRREARDLAPDQPVVGAYDEDNVPVKCDGRQACRPLVLVPGHGNLHKCAGTRDDPIRRQVEPGEHIDAAGVGRDGGGHAGHCGIIAERGVADAPDDPDRGTDQRAAGHQATVALIRQHEAHFQRVGPDQRHCDVVGREDPADGGVLLLHDAGEGGDQRGIGQRAIGLLDGPCQPLNLRRLLGAAGLLGLKRVAALLQRLPALADDQAPFVERTVGDVGARELPRALEVALGEVELLARAGYGGSLHRNAGVRLVPPGVRFGELCARVGQRPS